MGADSGPAAFLWTTGLELVLSRCSNMAKSQRTGVSVDRRCIAADPETEKAGMRTILLISCVALTLCGSRLSVGEDTSIDAPSWSSLRLNGNSSIIDPASSADPNHNVVRQAP